MKPPLLLFSCALILSFVFGAQQTSQKPAWDLTLAPNQQVSSTLTVVNRCQKEHAFRVTAEAAPFVRLPSQTEVRVAGEKSEVMPVVFDTTNLAPGKYEGKLAVACIDCQTEKTCTQDREVLQVKLAIEQPFATATPSPSDQRPAPIPAASQQPTVTSSPAVSPASPPIPEVAIATDAAVKRDCCDELRKQNGGKIQFQHGANGIELSGRKLTMRVGDKTATWNLDFDLEAEFCKLDDYRVASRFTQFMESKTAGGSNRERASSISVLLTGPDRDNRATRPHFFFQFMAQYLDADGKMREYAATLSLDEAACTWQLQLLKDSSIAEISTHPPRAANVLSADVGTNPAFRHLFLVENRDWWDAMFSLLLEINGWYGWLQTHPDPKDGAYIDEAFRRWRQHMLDQIKSALDKGQGLNRDDRAMLNQMTKLLDRNELSQQVIQQFIQLHNRFRDGIKLRD